MSLTRVRVFALAVAASACAGGAQTSGSGGAAPTPEARQQSTTTRDRDVITQEELSNPSVRAQSVLDLIRSARPHFLTQRGKNSHSDDEAGKVHASIDNGRIVPIEELGNIHAGSVIEVRYLNPSQAMQKFGGAAREGPVILVRITK